ncbi:MAG: NADH-quinone oxidoreductase subunit C [Candidatus Njordarchaeota archaeon]
MAKTKPTEEGTSTLNSWISEIVSGAKVEVDKFGTAWVEVPVEKIKELLSGLKEKGYTHFITISGVDEIKDNKMVLIYHVAPSGLSGYPILCVKTTIPRDNPVAPSIVDIHNVALVYEREVYDLLGIKFEGHPNLDRILLPKDSPEGYHPLRKDFEIKEGE